jgi:hypothetical protein
LALAIPLGFVAAQPADASLTYLRCHTQELHWVHWPDDTITLCWQYSYHAQADGTGSVTTNLFVECSQNCDAFDNIVLQTVKAINPKTGAVNDSQSIANIATSSLPNGVDRSLSLTGRDVGNETIQWSMSFQKSGKMGKRTDYNTAQYNDCVSLADPYFGPCDPV